MKKLFAVALGVLTAIGGFVDIGDLVTNAVVGSRFGLGLAWVVLVGVVGICVYAQMSGRVAAVSGRATFEIIRERLGPRAGIANLAASFLINLLTVTAEIGGVALALQLATSVDPRLVDPGRRVRRVDRGLAGAVRPARERDRAARAHPDRVRGGPVHALAGLGIARGPGVPARAARRRARRDVLVLRGRAVRRGDDPVRGVLLLVGRHRGEVDREGPREVAAQRAGRIPPRRAPLDRDRRVRRRRAAARRDRRDQPQPGRAARRRGRRQDRAVVRDRRHPRGDVRRRARDHPLERVHARAVLRMVVGQVPPPGARRRDSTWR